LNATPDAVATINEIETSKFFRPGVVRAEARGVLILLADAMPIF
jgi:hypothetical protein